MQQLSQVPPMAANNMNRRNALGLIGSSLALTGCWGGISWRQKLTVTVQTPTGEVSGSSVSRAEMTFAEDAWLAPGYAYSGAFGGEATFVEVAPGKFLFALMTERMILMGLRNFIGPEAASSPKKKDILAMMEARSLVKLDPNDYFSPPLVTFTDITEPTTVREVKPDNLAAAFGPGFALKSMTLEITDEPVMKGEVKKVLPWFQLLESNLDGTKHSSPQLGLSNNLNVSHFSTEK
jgi:hypothetical protein